MLAAFSSAVSLWFWSVSCITRDWRSRSPSRLVISESFKIKNIILQKIDENITREQLTMPS